MQKHLDLMAANALLSIATVVAAAKLPLLEF